MGRAIGLDVGTKTIGVAVTDPMGWFPQPVCTIARKGVAADAARICQIITERGAQHLVVGLPYELDGSEARSARLARQIGEAVAAQSGLVAEYVDERFSSVASHAVLAEAGVYGARRKAVIDQAAAMEILTRWIQGER